MSNYPVFAEFDGALVDLAAQSPIPSLLDGLRATITRRASEVRSAYAAHEGIPLEDVDVMIEPSPDGMAINVTARRIERYGPSPFVAYYPWWRAIQDGKR